MRSVYYRPRSARSAPAPRHINVKPYGKTKYYSAAGVALAAPGYLMRVPETGGPSSYSDLIFGTSLAAPTVAGAGALLRQAFEFLKMSDGGLLRPPGTDQGDGWSAMDAGRKFLTLMLLMGDGAGADGEFKPEGVDRELGFGRFRAHWPEQTDNPGTPAGSWGWTLRVFHLAKNGDEVLWRAARPGAGAKGVSVWKAAFAWFDNDLSRTSDVDVSVYDTCNRNKDLAYDGSYDIRARLAVKDSDIPLQCLEVSAYGFAIPPEGVTVFAAEYYTDEDEDLH